MRLGVGTQPARLTRLLRVPFKHSSANRDHKQLARLMRGDRRAELEKPAILLECHDLSGLSPPKCREVGESRVESLGRGQDRHFEQRKSQQNDLRLLVRY